MPPLHIVVVTQQVGRIFSGPGLHARNLIHSLVQDGHQVTVIAPPSQRPAGNLPYEFVPVPEPAFARTQARWISLSYSFGLALKNLEAARQVDLVHFTDAREALFTRTRAGLVGNVNDTYAAELFSPGYYRRHYTDWLQRWAYYVVTRRLEGLVYHRLDAILANSRFTAQMIQAAYRLPAEKVFVCYKSVDAAYWRREMAARSGKRAAGPKRVLFVGTNMQRKGLPTLIKAAPQVARALPGVQFLVVGEDKAIPAMRKLCCEEGVEGNFQFLGWKSQAELLELYAGADVFVLPSLTEALGVALLEAMAAGLPVIGSDAGGIPEIITDGVNGLLVPPDNPARLADALVRALSSPELASALVQGGFENLGRFDLHTMMARTYEVYAAVRSSKTAR